MEDVAEMDCVSIGAEAPHFVTLPEHRGLPVNRCCFNWGRSPSFCDEAETTKAFVDNKEVSFNWGRSPSFCDKSKRGAGFRSPSRFQLGPKPLIL